MYKKAHTTSTKCQYQAAASNPIWCSFVKWPSIHLIKQTNMKIVPTITCNPWKPVIIKKVEPYIPSAIVNGASIYSISCKQVKDIASVKVAINPSIADKYNPLVIAWWVYVIVTPE